MTGNLIFAILLVGYLVVFLGGEAYGRRRESDLYRRRIMRRSLYRMAPPVDGSFEHTIREIAAKQRVDTSREMYFALHDNDRHSRKAPVPTLRSVQ